MKQTSRTDTTGPWRLRNILKPHQQREDGSAFFAGELGDQSGDYSVMLQNMKDQGLSPNEDKEAQQILSSAFDHVKSAISGQENLPPIACLAVYDMQDQKDGASLRKSDAVAYYHYCKGKNRTLYGIAVSVQGIQQGRDYIYLLLLHEYAHIILYDAGLSAKAPHDHDDVFIALLNRLIQRFNDAARTSIKNDYEGKTA